MLTNADIDNLTVSNFPVHVFCSITWFDSNFLDLPSKRPMQISFVFCLKHTMHRMLKYVKLKLLLSETNFMNMTYPHFM